MPFHEVSRMDARLEFVMLATAGGANVRQLCRRFGISPTTGYKWLERWRADGVTGLQERSRREQASPAHSAAAIEAAVLSVRAFGLGRAQDRQDGATCTIRSAPTRRPNLRSPPAAISRPALLCRDHYALRIRARRHRPRGPAGWSRQLPRPQPQGSEGLPRQTCCIPANKRGRRLQCRLQSSGNCSRRHPAPRLLVRKCSRASEHPSAISPV